MIFKNRIDAGQKLAIHLEKFRGVSGLVVIGLPRGGVPIAYEIKKSLNIPLDIVCPRKIGSPFNKEYAIGAITETGDGVFDSIVISRYGISQEYINEEVSKEKLEAQYRLKTYRGERPPRNLKGKTVIIADDGLATGATMKAAIKSVKSEGAKEIIVAVPISSQSALEEIREIVDQVVCLDTPLNFNAVGQFYESFDPTTDQEVIRLMEG